MTTVYSAYYQAYDSGRLDLTNISFLVMLVDGSYIPDASDTLDDVVGLIVSVPYVLVDRDILTFSMSEIVVNSLKLIEEYMESYPSEVLESYRNLTGDNFSLSLKDAGAKQLVVYDPRIDILCFTEELM
jgi:hypothetical protein